MKLYKHQAAFITRNPDRALLVWETGTGKTIAACEWIKKRKHLLALVICPKAIIGKWERDLLTWGARADVVSRDGAKKLDLAIYDAIVIDEAQDFAAPLFSGGRSQRAQKIYEYVKEKRYPHILLLTATPIRSTAWNCHTLACYLRTFWDVRAFRDKFFYLSQIFGRTHWEPMKGWRKDIRPYLESISDIVLAKDCADIPKQRHRVINIPWEAGQEDKLAAELEEAYADGASEWHARRRSENGQAKYDALTALLDGYRKAIVICYYRAQIDQYAKLIGNERQVFVLHGGVRDQDAVIKAAREADDCVFLLQASMGAGFDASEFSVMIFASMSFKFVDDQQSLGRINRLNNLHENDYIYLLGGKCDTSVYRTVLAGNDFHPPAYLADK